MTPTGASHCAPSGAAALSVGKLRSPRMSWRQTGTLRAIRLSVVQSLDDCSACAPALPDASTASANPKPKANLREITAGRHYHQKRPAKLGFAACDRVAAGHDCTRGGGTALLARARRGRLQEPS